MKKQITFPLAVFIALVTLIGFTLTNHDAFAQSRTTTDTLPKKPKDFNEILIDLDKNMKELELQLQNKVLVPSFDGEKLKAELDKAFKDMDPEKMKRQIEEAMKNLDTTRLHLDLTQALVSVDMVKMQKELEEAMKHFDTNKIHLNQVMVSVDMEKMQKEMEEAMKHFDTNKLNLQIHQLVATVDMEKIKKELENVKSIDIDQLKTQLEVLKTTDLKKVELELKDLQPHLQNTLQQARESMANAKEEITAYRDFTEALDKDGLIDKDGNYTIEHKEGKLTINGNVQSKEVYDKYNSFLSKYKKILIKKDGTGVDIHVD
jgi:hypothetical protein